MKNIFSCGHANPGAVKATNDETTAHFLRYLELKNPTQCFPCYHKKKTGKQLNITRQ